MIAHGSQCDYHCDQYDSDCTCGATRPKAPFYDGLVIKAAHDRIARDQALAASLQDTETRQTQAAVIAEDALRAWQDGDSSRDHTEWSVEQTFRARAQALTSPAAAVEGLRWNANEVWEGLFGFAKGDVPDALDETTCGVVADWLNSFTAYPLPTPRRPDALAAQPRNEEEGA